MNDTERLTSLVEAAKKGDATYAIVSQLQTLLDEARQTVINNVEACKDHPLAKDKKVWNAPIEYAVKYAREKCNPRKEQ